MHRFGACSAFLSLLVIAVSAGSLLAASPGEVVINEIFPNAASYYDASEYIEIYNKTDSPIDISGWCLSGTEYDGYCWHDEDLVNGYPAGYGEHSQEFPAGTIIPAHGYIVVARDVTTDDSTGYRDKFDEDPDFEMYDSNMIYENDDLAVDNMICQNPDEFDDQIRFIPGAGDYSKSCGGLYNRYEALWLYYIDGPDTVVIDAMEYRYLSCTSDQCSGVNGANDAFPSYPDEEISLGRDPISTDDNNSSTDFQWEVPTPGDQNTLNTPPDLWGLEYSPCVPMPEDSVTITIYAVDDGSVQLVQCYANVDSAGWNAKTMFPTVGEDSLYHVNLAPEDSSAQVMFYVKATDDFGAETLYPSEGADAAYRYSVDYTPISAIQTVDIGDDSSYVVGEVKNIRGIVTAGRGTYPGISGGDALFVVQDAFGPWTGIWVYDPSYSVPAEVGDSVSLSGFISEYYNVTELYLFPDCYQEHKSGCEVPAPFVVATGTINTASTLAERYEGVLVRTENVEVTNDSLGYGEWEIYDNTTAPCRVDDASYYFYTPKEGNVLEAVQGILFYSFDDYKIEPRGDDDLVGPLAIYSLVYSPHAPVDPDEITVSCVVVGENTITSVKLFYSTNDGATYDSTAMSSPDSVYSVVIGPYDNNTVVDYYVEAWDDAGFVARKPEIGSYDFRVGMKTIYDVQYYRKPSDDDSSALAGEPVNVSGVVTAGTGEFSDYYFFIEEDYTGNPGFKGVKVYDRTGTVEVSRGDSVTVSGDVWEYYNETEIAMFFPEAITINSKYNPVPDAYQVTTASIATSEDWEGVLVSAHDVTVVDPDAGFGDWLITDGAPADTCRVGDDGDYSYEPQAAEEIGIVYGVVMYAYRQYRLQPRDDDDICETGESGIEDERLPTALMMSVRPNPMSRGGIVRFALPASGRVAIKVYNVEGELVTTLADSHFEAGTYSVDWNGSNSRGHRVTSGIYFMRLETGRDSIVKKVVISR